MDRRRNSNIGMLFIAAVLCLSGWAATNVPCANPNACARELCILGALKPTFTPELVFSNESIASLVNEDRSLDSVIFTGTHNFEQLKGKGAVVLVKAADTEEYHRLRNLPEVKNAKRIIGVGGGVVLDMAKAVGADREVTVYPTILSTNCITSNRSVLGTGVNSFSYQSGAPARVVVSLKDALAMPKEVRNRWSQSGFGDYVSEISAAIDRLGEKNQATYENISKADPEVLAALDWFGKEFTDWNEPALRKLGSLLHTSGLNVIEAETNAHRIGGEHLFYKALMDVNRDLRRAGPTHGQIVAIGSLITAKIHARNTGDTRIYDSLRRAFARMNLPITWEAMEREGLSKENLIAAVKTVAGPDTKRTTIGTYFKEHDFAILDDVFAP